VFWLSLCLRMPWTWGLWEALPLHSSLGIAIPIFTRPVKASRGSGEAGRGIGEENQKLWAQEKGRFHPHSGRGWSYWDGLVAGE